MSAVARRALSPAVRALTRPPVGLAVLAALLLAGSALGLSHLPLDPLPAAWHLPLPLVALLFALGEVVVVHLHVQRQRRSVSLSEVPLVLALFFASPVALVAGRLVGSAVALVAHRRQSGTKLVLNLIVFCAESVAALVVFRALLPVDPWGSGSWPAAYAGAVVASCTSLLAVSLLISLYERSLRLRALLQDFLWGVAAALGLGTSGLLAVAALRVDPRNAVLLVVVGALLLVAYRAYGALAERHLALERLHRFGQVLAASPEIDHVLRTLLEQARELLRAEAAEVTFLPDGDGGRGLRVRLLPNSTLERTVVEDLRTVDPVSAQVVDTDAPVLLERRRVGEAPTAYLQLRSQREAVLVPLRGEAGVVGTLSVADRPGETGTFDREDVRLLQSVADSAARALVKGQLIDELRQGAYHDSLTGLPNRAQVMQVLESARAAAGDGHPSAVYLLDLNGFKAVNDSFGHERGDLLLQEVGRRLIATAPDTALVGRLGGDEFAVVAPGVVGAAGAVRLGDQLLEGVAHLVEHRGLALPIGAALGVSLVPEHGTEPSEVLRRADAAMYAAKRSGSGRTVVWVPALEDAGPLVPVPRRDPVGSRAHR